MSIKLTKDWLYLEAGHADLYMVIDEQKQNEFISQLNLLVNTNTSDGVCIGDESWPGARENYIWKQSNTIYINVSDVVARINVSVDIDDVKIALNNITKTY